MESALITWPDFYRFALTSRREMLLDVVELVDSRAVLKILMRMFSLMLLAVLAERMMYVICS